jgi:adenylyltransferase/sulfurtransferase
MAASARAACLRLNPAVTITALCTRLAASSATRALVAAHDVVVDCTDNAGTRYALSDAAVAMRVPVVSGSALGWEGQVGCALSTALKSQSLG